MHFAKRAGKICPSLIQFGTINMSQEQLVIEMQKEHVNHNSNQGFFIRYSIEEGIHLETMKLSKQYRSTTSRVPVQAVFETIYRQRFASKNVNTDYDFTVVNPLVFNIYSKVIYT